MIQAWNSIGPGFELATLENYNKIIAAINERSPASEQLELLDEGGDDRAWRWEFLFSLQYAVYVNLASRPWLEVDIATLTDPDISEYLMSAAIDILPGGIRRRRYRCVRQETHTTDTTDLDGNTLADGMRAILWSIEDTYPPPLFDLVLKFRAQLEGVYIRVAGAWVLDDGAHDADIVSSEKAAPDHTPTGTIRDRDIIGFWLFEDIRDVLNRMRWLAFSTSLAVERRNLFGQTDGPPAEGPRTRAAARAEATAALEESGSGEASYSASGEELYLTYNTPGIDIDETTPQDEIWSASINYSDSRGALTVPDWLPASGGSLAFHGIAHGPVPTLAGRYAAEMDVVTLTAMDTGVTVDAWDLVNTVGAFSTTPGGIYYGNRLGNVDTPSPAWPTDDPVAYQAGLYPDFIPPVDGTSTRVIIGSVITWAAVIDYASTFQYSTSTSD